MKNKIGLSVVALTMLASMIACSTSVDMGSLVATKQPTARSSKVYSPTSKPPRQTTSPGIITGPEVRSDDVLTILYEQVNPGVVAIRTLGETGDGLGSGWVFDMDGHIVTNYHVVEGATDLEVDFPSGYKVEGEILATDLDSDLAVIKVDVPPDELFPLTTGDSEQLRVGQTVVAIGNPFGLSSTMTVGIVSAKGRTMESFRETPDGGVFSAGDLIQTDAAINPGNSGGPLLDLGGRVVGVNRAIRTAGNGITGDVGNIGIGFAISINIVNRVVPVLIEKGTYDYPYIGITAHEELSLLEARALGLNYTSGAYIVGVQRGGPADKAGIKAGVQSADVNELPAGGDLVVAVDGRPVQVFADLLGYLMANKSPGEQVVLTVIRDDEPMDVTILLDKRP